MVCLIKPQFEAGAKIMRKAGGVLRDEQTIAQAADKIKRFVHASLPRLEIIGVMKSPILGGDGNTEYLIGLRAKSRAFPSHKSLDF